MGDVASKEKPVACPACGAPTRIYVQVKSERRKRVTYIRCDRCAKIMVLED